MTVNAQAYSILLTTMKILVTLQEHLIDYPDADPDDVLFDELQAVIEACKPALVRLGGEPVLTPQIQTFLEGLQR